MVRSHARRSGISSVDDLESESVSTEQSNTVPFDWVISNADGEYTAVSRLDRDFDSDTDIGALIQRLHDGANSPVHIHITAGRYNKETAVSVTNDLMITGDGSVRIDPATTEGGTQIIESNHGGPASFIHNNEVSFTLKNLDLVGPGSNSGINGVNANMVRSVWNNVGLAQYDKGISAGTIAYCTFRDCQLDLCDTLLYYDDSSNADNFANVNRVVGGRWLRAKEQPAIDTNGDFKAWTFENVSFEGHYYGVSRHKSTSNGGPEHITYSNCWVENVNQNGDESTKIFSVDRDGFGANTPKNFVFDFEALITSNQQGVLFEFKDKVKGIQFRGIEPQVLTGTEGAVLTSSGNIEQVEFYHSNVRGDYDFTGVACPRFVQCEPFQLDDLDNNITNQPRNGYEFYSTFHGWEQKQYKLRSSPPPSPSNGTEYLDDGTNTSTGEPAKRIYVDDSWVDQN